MSQFKHTPGTWATKTAKVGGDVAITADIDGEACILAEAWADIRHVNEDSYVEAAANARLMASAPELLEALDALICVVGLTAFKYETQRAVLQESVDKARAAIAKATGGDA